MTLYVFTLNWNNAKRLAELHDSLIPTIQHINIPIKWLIKDNGSIDNPKNILSNDIDCSLYEINHNRDNFAKGVNFLYNIAKPNNNDLILLLNNDVVIKDPLSIKYMLDLQSRVKADVVGCRLLYKNSNKLQHAGVIFGKRYNNLPFHYRPGEESDVWSKKDRHFQAVTAACCLVTAEAFNRIGGMDEKFSWAFDDIDMCLQIGQFGKIVYCGSTYIYHEESVSLKVNPVNKMFLNNNLAYFRRKWDGKYEIDHDLYLKNPRYKEIT